MIDVAIATEDALSEALIETLLHHGGRPVRIAQRFRRQGFGYFSGSLAGCLRRIPGAQSGPRLATHPGMAY